MATSLGPCTGICDAASYGTGPRSACWTPWCKCECHRRAAAAEHQAADQARREACYVAVPQRWEGDDS